MNVKDATHATVHDYPGGAESLAPRMGIKSPQVLRNKVNPATDTHHLRLDEAVRMMAVTGDYRIIDDELTCLTCGAKANPIAWIADHAEQIHRQATRPPKPLKPMS